MAEWETIKLPKEMVQKIEEYTKTEYAKERGYTSKSQIVVAAVRSFLQTEQKIKFNLRSKKYNKLLPFRRISTMIFCESCNSQICEHAIHLLKHSELFDWELIEEGSTLAEAPKFSK